MSSPTTSAPVLLGPNQPPQFYAGGAAVAAFRGAGAEDPRSPEDWVASTTTLFGQDAAGLSELPDGTRVREAVSGDPERFLGAAHVAAYGDDPALLVKLLDAGQRLPVHVHPTREFAGQHLDSRHGKTEAWYVVGATGDDPCVHVGFRDAVSAATVASWVDRQDGRAMLAAMHRVPVGAGDAVLVPAGTPHAIGEGVFVVELQEPTDFSVMLERDAFGITGGDLGLGARALDCLDRTAWDDDRLDAVRTHPTTDRGDRVRVLPAAADPFFRAELLRGDVELEPGYAVLVVLAGAGSLATDGGAVDVRRGHTVLVPYAAGAGRLTGNVQVLRCRPPDPERP